jgi:hypothetical protein
MIFSVGYELWNYDSRRKPFVDSGAAFLVLHCV